MIRVKWIVEEHPARLAHVVLVAQFGVEIAT
jgi:hypothetical protein